MNYQHSNHDETTIDHTSSPLPGSILSPGTGHHGSARGCPTPERLCLLLPTPSGQRLPRTELPDAKACQPRMERPHEGYPHRAETRRRQDPSAGRIPDGGGCRYFIGNVFGKLCKGKRGAFEPVSEGHGKGRSAGWTTRLRLLPPCRQLHHGFCDGLSGEERGAGPHPGGTSGEADERGVSWRRGSRSGPREGLPPTNPSPRIGTAG